MVGKKQTLSKKSTDNTSRSLGASNKAETDKNLGKFDLEALIARVYQKYASHAEQKSLRLDLDIQLKQRYVTSKQAYIEGILEILLANAVQYSEEGRITLALRQIDQQNFEFSVSDTGMGIPKSDRQKVFQKGFRVQDYRVREVAGDGMGLYKAQKLASALGTKIELISRINFGSTFSFTVQDQTNK